MGQAARMILIENGQILVMERQKNNQTYYTLVGGRKNDDETIEECLVREIREETGLEITSHQLVFTEQHNDERYNDQFIFIVTVAPHGDISLGELSEEALLNNNPYTENKHTPYWIPLGSFSRLPFRTPALGQAIERSLKKGFPRVPITL